MNKKKSVWVILLLLVLGVIGSGILIFVRKEDATKVAKDTEVIVSFADITDYELLHNIPVPVNLMAKLVTADDFGGGTYGVRINETSLEDYQKYLSQLDADGFTKYVDNGEQGLEGYVYTSHYQKDKTLVVVTHIVKMKQTVISVSDKENLSPSLIYSEEYLAGNMEGAQTSLHVPELYEVGNCFIIQLKNGHFIVNDGGMDSQLPYLLDYLESLVPEGEIPVVEAWVFSHPHGDHVGAFIELHKRPQYLKRVYVESIYFTDINDEEVEFGKGENMGTYISNLRYTATILKNTKGVAPKVYRMRMGERYYFNDITMDVVYTNDVENAGWATTNSSSTQIMYVIEGQKVFLGADADWENQLFVAKAYDSSYFQLTLYQPPHHGENIFNEITDYYESIGTIIYPNYQAGSNEGNGKVVQNEHLQSLATEFYSWGDGSKVFTFPYQTGDVKSLPLMEWKYELSPKPQRGN